MSKRAWYNCNERKARSLIAQGHKVRIRRGRWQYKRPVRQTKECRACDGHGIVRQAR